MMEYASHACVAHLSLFFHSVYLIYNKKHFQVILSSSSYTLATVTI